MSSQRYKTQGTEGLFGKHYRLKKLSGQGDPLEKLNRPIMAGSMISCIRAVLGPSGQKLLLDN